MTAAMTAEETSTAECPVILEQDPSLAVRVNNRCIEIDQVTVIDRIALGGTYAVRIVTGGARRVLLHYMFFMIWKTFVIQNTLSLMTFIAQ